MSKSIKRNNKYYGYDDDHYEDHYEDHGSKLKEKRIRSALRSRNKNAIFDLIEEDY
jgi:hypothetical protein